MILGVRQSGPCQVSFVYNLTGVIKILSGKLIRAGIRILPRLHPNQILSTKVGLKFVW